MRWSKGGLLLVLLVIVIVQLESQQSTLTTVEQANAAYRAGDYAAAIRLYEALVVSGQSDAVMYFNLGNAYFEADDLGRALLNYIRAQKSIPRDSDLNRNLALTRALRVDVQSEETALVDAIAAATTSVMTRGELATLVFGVWTLWCGSSAAFVALPLWRTRLRTPLLIGALLVMVGAVLLVGRLYVETERPAAVITAFQVEAMSGPSKEYVPLFTLYSAAEGRVLEQRGEWARLLLPDGRQGWIPQMALTTL